MCGCQFYSQMCPECLDYGLPRVRQPRDAEQTKALRGRTEMLGRLGPGEEDGEGRFACGTPGPKRGVFRQRDRLSSPSGPGGGLVITEEAGLHSTESRGALEGFRQRAPSGLCGGPWEDGLSVCRQEVAELWRRCRLVAVTCQPVPCPGLGRGHLVQCQPLSSCWWD